LTCVCALVFPFIKFVCIPLPKKQRAERKIKSNNQAALESHLGTEFKFVKGKNPIYWEARGIT